MELLYQLQQLQLLTIFICKIRKHSFVSGQLPFKDSKLAHIGKVGSQVSLKMQKKQQNFLRNWHLAQLKVACDGDLDRVVRCVKLGILLMAMLNLKITLLLQMAFLT